MKLFMMLLMFNFRVVSVTIIVSLRKERNQQDMSDLEPASSVSPSDLDEDIVRQIEATFNPRNLLSAFQSLVTIIHEQKSEITSLKVQLHSFESSLDAKLIKYEQDIGLISSNLEKSDSSLAELSSAQHNFQQQIEATKGSIASSSKESIEMIKRLELHTTPLESQIPELQERINTLEATIQKQAELLASRPLPQPSSPSSPTPPPLIMPTSSMTSAEVRSIVMDILATYKFPAKADAPNYFSMENSAIKDKSSDYEEIRVKHERKKEDERPLPPKKKAIDLSRLPWLTNDRKSKICSDLKAMGTAIIATKLLSRSEMIRFSLLFFFESIVLLSLH